jgi:hypothetical protein
MHIARIALFGLVALCFGLWCRKATCQNTSRSTDGCVPSRTDVGPVNGARSPPSVS